MNQKSIFIATTKVQVIPESRGWWLFQATLANWLSLDCSCVPALQHQMAIFSSSTNAIL